MSNTSGFYVQKETDKNILSAFHELCTKYEPLIFQLQITLCTDDNFSIHRDQSFKDFYDSSLVKELVDGNAYLINTINVTMKNHILLFTRGELLTPPSPVFDYISSINRNNNANTPEAVTPEQKLGIYKFLQEKLCPISTPNVISTNLPNEYDALLSQHNSMLSKLEELNSELLIKNQEKSQELDKAYLNKRESLEAEYTDKTNTLQGKYDKNNSDLEQKYTVKASEVEDRAKELDDISSKLDNRNNTHVRREIRDKMLDDVEARIQDFGVSQSTSSKRKPVFVAIMSLISIFALLLGFSIWEAATEHAQRSSLVSTNKIQAVEMALKIIDIEDKNANSDFTMPTINFDNSILYWLWLRITFFSFGLFGSILFYIKWQNRWAENHSESEFQLQQFHVDVNRANWVIESCLEWRKETESAIPSVLLESITKGLFTNESKQLEQVIHPSDELASALLGSASKLKMNLGGNELEINKPGKIKPQSPK